MARSARVIERRDVVAEEPGLLGPGMRDQGLLGREFQLEVIAQERTHPGLDLLGFLPRSVEAKQEIVGVPDISQSSVVRIELVVLSEKAADTFRVQGFPEEKLFYLPRGVDVERFRPGVRPPIFRAVFSGALIERKGIHHLLEAWHRLDLKDAELWLGGSVHNEAKPHLEKFWRDNIRVVGFARDPETYLSQGTVHIFPSQCEGSAKVVYEAAACGLPQITTREAGDVVNDGVEGIIIQPGNVGELAAAILELYRHPEKVARMSEAARRRVVDNFTWDHFRARLLTAYEKAMRMKR